MRAIEFKEQTAVLGKPENMTADECQPLPVFRDGKTCVSCWELTPEELKLINETKVIYLGVLSGNTQPPVFLTVESPFE
jgi:hypothetical protein